MAHRQRQRARGHAVATPRRLVLDTQVWLDLLVFRDPRLRVLDEALRAGAAVALMDARMRAELARVLAYPAIAPSCPDAADVLATADRLSRLVPVPPAPAATLPRCRDPDDQMFVELALALRVDALLSRDGALLRMAPRLRREGVAVLEPARWCEARGDQISKR